MYKNLNVIFAGLFLLFITITSNKISDFKNDDLISAKDKEAEDKNHEALWNQLYSMQEDPVLKRIPSEELYKALEDFNLYLSPNKLSTTLEWTELGPNTIGGRTRAILVDPNDNTNKALFAAGVSGGLWKTNDITVATPTWQKIDHTWDNIKITSLASDPTNSQIIYAGTGEISGTGGFGNGVYKSTDGGTTWSHLSSSSSIGSQIGDIIVRNENGTGVVYVGSSHSNDRYADTWSDDIDDKTGGLYRSTDGGASWTNVGPYVSNNSGYSMRANFNNFALGTSDRIWAATDGFKYSNWTQFGGNLYYSDNGTTWNKVNWKPNSDTSKRVIVAVAPSDKNTIYIAVEGDNREIGFLMKSTDNGSNWSSMTLPPVQVEATGTHYGRNDQAEYSMHIKVDPNDPNTLIFGMITQYKSTDGGANWTEISNWRSNATTPPYVHADHHNLIYIDSNKIISANDGGVFYSEDGGTNWSSKIENYNVGQFYHADLHPSIDEYVLGGTQDNGSWRINTQSNYENEETGGDGAFSHISSTNPSVQFTQYTYNRIYRTTNEWDGWTNNSYNNYLLWDDDNGAFISTSDYDATNDVYYITGNATKELRILKNASTTNYFTSTLQNTQDTQGIFLDLPLTSRATAIKVSPNNPEKVFVGDDEGHFGVVTNAATTNGSDFNYIDLDPSNTLPQSSYMRSIDVGADDSKILVTFSNYGIDSIWQTTDSGTTWTSLEGNLPNIPVGAAVYNPNDYNEVILGTDLGIWSSDNVNNGSVQWSANSGNIPNVPVWSITIRPDGAMVAATHGRGLWFSTSLVSGGGGGGGTSYPAATFTISDLDQTYLRSTSEVTITPDFSAVTNFTVDKYYVAIGTGTSTATQNDVLDWTEITASGGELDITGLNLSDYSSYSISLKGKDANDNYNAVATELFNTYKSLLGDSNNDWVIDQTDLDAFINNWEDSGSDIGPATGTAPYMAPSFDQEYNIYDVNVFSRNWVWSAANRTIEKIKQTGLTPLIDDLNIIKFGNTITIEIPEEITSGRIQIQKPNNETEFKVANNLSGMLIFENEDDFYQLAFGNLQRTNGVITLEILNTVDSKLDVAYEFYIEGTIQSNELILSDPDENKLYQNYPNPFSSETTIEYDLAETTSVTINIYNTVGSLIKEIDQGDQIPGKYSIIWDGTNNDNESVSSGIYFYQLRTKNYNKTEKMTLVK